MMCNNWIWLLLLLCCCNKGGNSCGCTPVQPRTGSFLKKEQECHTECHKECHKEPACVPVAPFAPKCDCECDD